MGKAIPYDFRVKIIERRKAGEDYSDIADDLQLSISGVKKLWYKYCRQGDAALSTAYKNCGRKSPYGSDVRQAVKKIRDNAQGAGYVRSKLEMQYDNGAIPSARTIQRWWSAEGVSRPRGPVHKRKKKGGAAKSTKPGK